VTGQTRHLKTDSKNRDMIPRIKRIVGMAAIWLVGFLRSSWAWLSLHSSQYKLQEPRASRRLYLFHFLRKSSQRPFRFHTSSFSPSHHIPATPSLPHPLPPS